MPRQAARVSRAILITRPEPGAAESARAVAALGWEAVLAPALTLTAQPFKLPGNCQAIIITSRAAARALPPATLPVVAVGEATAAEARARGFAEVRAAAGDAAALTALIGKTLKPEAGTLCLAVGEGYALDLAEALRAKGFRVIRRVVYAARPRKPCGTVAFTRHYSPHPGLRAKPSGCCVIRGLRLPLNASSPLRSAPASPLPLAPWPGQKSAPPRVPITPPCSPALAPRMC
jgi:uroporphyrinogen-III synthase